MTPPVLIANDDRIAGEQTDTRGFFWQFDVRELLADTVYRLQLVDARNQKLCDAWPLRTLPHPDSKPRHLRILTYTCAGGDESLLEPDGTRLYLSIADRRRLLRRGLQMAPDVVIANGDHIYYDQRSMLVRKPPGVIAAHKALFNEFGMLDRTLPALGSANEDVIKNVGDRQIASLYGVMLRSTPVFMLTDDHDLFDNDEANEDYITLPPDPSYREAARAIQRLYLPEFLPDDSRPADLPGSGADDRATGVSEVFGSLRYGKLFEGLLYDTKRFVSIDGEAARMVPQAVEDWLCTRSAAMETRHLAHIPSTPFGWTAGKWGEWYPDVLQKDRSLGTDEEKPYWPEGWWQQHQRLLSAIGNQSRRVPVVLSGDLHMFAAGTIEQSGDLKFSDNPIYSVVVGPLGTGNPAFPSAARNILPQVPVSMRNKEFFPPLEKNGFSVLDIQPSGIDVQFFAWRPPESVDLINDLAASFEFTIPDRS